MKGLMCFLCMNAMCGVQEEYSGMLSDKIHVPSGRDPEELFLLKLMMSENTFKSC